MESGRLTIKYIANDCKNTRTDCTALPPDANVLKCDVRAVIVFCFFVLGAVHVRSCIVHTFSYCNAIRPTPRPPPLATTHSQNSHIIRARPTANDL